MTALHMMVVLAVGCLGVFGLGALAGAACVGMFWRDSLTAQKSEGHK
ncbi:hypothetical protein [Prescottella agglutinans]|uniref:Uncharacterized protein n=1 Tax=Prescottella agglutinans TaxID=1644129 RepID=A0ABT6MG46_9NOCA|nr:hypothetical protein [Prescottella agglutinans]MDH6282854.1 hypothetical protein [Prescottella agglutinans]